MKRLIPAAIIVAAVLSLHFVSEHFIKSTCATAVGLAEQCEEEWIAGKDCSKTLSALKDYWNEKEYGLSFFVNHEKLSEVELEIKGLFEKTDAEEKSLFQAHIKNLYILLEQIRDDTTVNFKGIV